MYVHVNFLFNRRPNVVGPNFGLLWSACVFGLFCASASGKIRALNWDRRFPAESFVQLKSNFPNVPVSKTDAYWKMTKNAAPINLRLQFEIEIHSSESNLPVLSMQGVNYEQQHSGLQENFNFLCYFTNN
ncbi:conserved hypothetical protein [Trichinella spiralis]|uniref:hypothetical protein n=1 Tax=Trichinella spiralis TaxID=6334 RepID=UPI0001EFC64E|nr:conserved hypothetical protein [Trichinella spiralis]